MLNLGEEWQIPVVHRDNGGDRIDKKRSVWHVASLILAVEWEVMWVFEFISDDLSAEGEVCIEPWSLAKGRISCT